MFDLTCRSTNLNIFDTVNEIKSKSNIKAAKEGGKKSINRTASLLEYTLFHLYIHCIQYNHNLFL